MEGLLKSLSGYGPTVIRFTNGYWKCANEVHAYQYSHQKELARSSNPDLYRALRELLKQSAVTRQKLIEKIRGPKQGEFEYGSLNKDYKEIA